MMNEQRKEDKGGITQEGFYALSAWSKEPAGGGRITLAPDAEQGKDRFMAEWEAASKEQERSNGLVDWWKKEPSYQERTGKPRPDREWKKLALENSSLESEDMNLVKRGDGSQNAIVVDESDDDENGGMAVGMMEGVEKGLHGGISGEMVLRGPKLSSVEDLGGRPLRSMTTEPVMRCGSEESGDDLDAEGGVRFYNQDMKPVSLPGSKDAENIM